MLAPDRKRRRIAKSSPVQHPVKPGFDDTDNPNYSFAMEVYQQLLQLPADQNKFAKEKISEVLHSISCNLARMPDLVLIKLLSVCQSSKAILTLGATTPRLQKLLRERPVWIRFQRIVVVWNGHSTYPYVHFKKTNGEQIVKLRSDKVSQTRRAFAWLFNVCRPEQLDFTIDLDKNGNSLEDLVPALPPRDNSSPIERLRLTVRHFTQSDVKIFGRLVQSLPIGITHLDLNISIRKSEKPKLAGLGPILRKWLNDCHKVRVVRCLSLNDEAQTAVLSVLVTNAELTALSFDRSIELLNDNATAAVSHLCFAGPPPAYNTTRLIQQGNQQDFSRLNERARLNVTSICCISYRGSDNPGVKITELPSFFPNCRRMEFKWPMKLKEPTELGHHRYEELHATEKKKTILRIVAIKSSFASRLEQHVAIPEFDELGKHFISEQVIFEHVREKERHKGNHCFVEQEFEK